jgi:biopolymer transport protein ExbB/TolQ
VEKKTLEKLAVAGVVIAGAAVLVKKNKEKIKAWCDRAEKKLESWEEQLEEMDDLDDEEDTLEDAEERVKSKWHKTYATLKRRTEEHQEKTEAENWEPVAEEHTVEEPAQAEKIDGPKEEKVEQPVEEEAVTGKEEQEI